MEKTLTGPRVLDAGEIESLEKIRASLQGYLEGEEDGFWGHLYRSFAVQVDAVLEAHTGRTTGF